MKLNSPAKLNLFFRVLNKRDDGFHEIASLMQAISLCDLMHFEFANSDTITCTDPKIPLDHKNFIYQARELFRSKTGFKKPVTIHVEKQIPIMGGLGGGSGNLATTLYALNLLSKLKIPEEELAKWAGELSSDAPFFFSSGTAFAERRGEKIASLKPLPKQNIYLARPKGDGLSTPLVYKHCKPNFYKESPKKLMQAALQNAPIFINDLEPAAVSLKGELRGFKEKLFELGFDAVSMTGSGTTFFCFGKPRVRSLPKCDIWETSYVSRAKDGWYQI